MTNFDAFLAHNSLDKDIVRDIKQKLEHKNSELRLWLDEEQIYGGDTPLDEIKRGISQSRSAVFFIGLHGTGTWQGDLELPIIETLVIESNLGLISVLLPGVQTMPTDDKYSFLRTKSWINYQSINDAESLDRLLSGITRSRDINIPEQREIEIPPTIPNITLPNDVSKEKEIALNLASPIVGRTITTITITGVAFVIFLCINIFNSSKQKQIEVNTPKYSSCSQYDNATRGKDCPDRSDNCRYCS